jgi:vacuolar-type H+-ATPase subunit F/Vma7
MMKRDDLTGIIHYELEGLDRTIILEQDDLIFITFEAISNVYDVSFASIFKNTLSKLKENERVLYNTIKNDTGLSMFVEVPDMTNGETIKAVEKSIKNMITRQKETGSLAMIKDKR